MFQNPDFETKLGVISTLIRQIKMKELIPPKVDRGLEEEGVLLERAAGSSFLANILGGIIEFRKHITL